MEPERVTRSWAWFLFGAFTAAFGGVGVWMVVDGVLLGWFEIVIAAGLVRVGSVELRRSRPVRPRPVPVDQPGGWGRTNWG